jgi:hypothetical protein
VLEIQLINRGREYPPHSDGRAALSLWDIVKLFTIEGTYSTLQPASFYFPDFLYS